MKKWIKHWVVRFCWWLYSPLGTTLNNSIGGSAETGLEGGYEQRVPDKVGSGKKWTPRPIDKWETRPMFLKIIDFIKAMIGVPLMAAMILTFILVDTIARKYVA